LCTNRRSLQAGVTLIELIIAIVIISASLVGILGVMNLVTGHSSDVLMRKQAVVLAESLLEEIELSDMITASGVSSTTVTTANRLSDRHLVVDYNGYSTSGGISTLDGSQVLNNYNFSPAVSIKAINSGELGADVPAASAVRISVFVTDPVGNVVNLSGYRTAY